MNKWTYSEENRFYDNDNGPWSYSSNFILDSNGYASNIDNNGDIYYSSY